jgi:cytoskeletal protein CcmA (bactofilin family)
MFGSRGRKPEKRIDCLIGASTSIDGDIVFSGGLRIDGRVHGNVAASDGESGTLVVSEQAQVEGEIRVSHAVINGTVLGPVHASEYVELQSKANVTGDVHYRAIEIHLGAVVQGRLSHESETKSDKVVRLKPATND